MGIKPDGERAWAIWGTSRWIENDPDPATCAELVGLIRAGNEAAIRDAMAGDRAFGTAGLRGRLGAGSARMNRAVTIRASHTIAQHLLAGTTGPVGGGIRCSPRQPHLRGGCRRRVGGARLVGQVLSRSGAPPWWRTRPNRVRPRPSWPVDGQIAALIHMAPPAWARDAAEQLASLMDLS